MTSTVNRVTADAITGQSYSALSTSVGLVVVFVLLALLVAKELIRVRGGEDARAIMRGLDIAIMPLLCAFGMIMVLRLVDLLPH